MNKLKNWLTKEEGQGMVEYGLIIALVAIVVIGVLTALGGGLTETFQGIVDQLGGTGA